MLGTHPLMSAQRTSYYCLVGEMAPPNSNALFLLDGLLLVYGGDASVAGIDPAKCHMQVTCEVYVRA